MKQAAREFPADADGRSPKIAEDVRTGLLAARKSLPPYLLYDRAGSALYEQITGLDEYYLTGAERQVFSSHAAEMVACVRDAEFTSVGVVELGAGSATKTLLLLQALVRRQGATGYVPIDISSAALSEAVDRVAVALPSVTTKPILTTYEDALPQLSPLKQSQLVLFIGSSIGNMEDEAAAQLLSAVRGALRGRAWLLLGTDLRKSPARMLQAYDDTRGVTAAFNMNLLTRLNREFDAHFDIQRFRHRAVWNEAASRVEMHLESLEAQRVDIDALGISVTFRAGETIHTESSVKYDRPRVDALLARAGFRRVRTWFDEQGLFAVHLAS
jgi:L-histidine N-alpha-methyltransferase